jgi:hypothetical protein
LGTSRAGLATAVVSVLLVGLAGCNYSFRAGSGLPDYVRTVAVLPFDNETTRFELTDEIHQQLLRELPRALGVRSAGEQVADAVVRGSITNYSVNAPLFRPGATGQTAEVLQRQVVISIRVELVDLVENQILWEDQNLRSEGQYLEASETEEIGRTEAIELLVQRIVDGAQSNW